MRFSICVFILSAMLVFPSASIAVSPPPQNPQTQDPLAVPEDPQRQAAEKEMLKKANQERQAQLRRDTERLYELSAQLKQYVEKSNEDTLSLQVIRKAEEIEKLAHSVKEKMKGN